MSSIFNDSFQTQGPDTGSALALMEQALSARKQALDPTNILQSFEKGAKVLTDMEDRQRKANTANLKRKLASIPPALMEDLLKNGVDPIEFVQNSWSPIDVADEGLNTTWGNQIQAAKKDATARAVYNELNRTPEQVEQDMLNGVTVADRASPYADLADKELYSLESGQNQNVRDIQTAEAIRRLNAATPKERAAYLTKKGVLTGLGKFANPADLTLNRVFGGFNDKVTAYNTALATLNVDNVSAEDIRKGWLEGSDPILDMLEDQEYIDPSNATLQKAIQERKKWVSDNLTEENKRKIAAMSDDELMEFFRGNKSFENQDRMTGSSLTATAISEKNSMDKANAVAAQIEAMNANPNELYGNDETADKYATKGMSRGSRQYFTPGKREADTNTESLANATEGARRDDLTYQQKVDEGYNPPKKRAFTDYNKVRTDVDNARQNVAKDLANRIDKGTMILKASNRIMELAKEYHNPGAKKELNSNIENIIAHMERDGQMRGRIRSEVAKELYDKFDVPNEAREDSAYWDNTDDIKRNQVYANAEEITDIPKSSKEFLSNYKGLQTTNPARAAQLKTKYIQNNADKVLRDALDSSIYNKLTGSSLTEATVKSARLQGLKDLQEAYDNDVFNEEYLLKKEIFEAGIAHYASQSADITKAYIKEMQEARVHAKQEVANSRFIKIKDENKGVISTATPDFIKGAIYEYIPQNDAGHKIHNILNIVDPKTQSILLSEIVARMDVASEIKPLKTNKDLEEFRGKHPINDYKSTFTDQLASDLEKLYNAYKPDDEAYTKLLDSNRANTQSELMEKR